MERDAREAKHDSRRRSDEHREKADQQVEQEGFQQQRSPFHEELRDAGLLGRRLYLSDRKRRDEYRKQHHAEARGDDYPASGPVEKQR